MKVGWIGLGKLGLPCATVLAQHHAVHGYDISDLPWKAASGNASLNHENGFSNLIADANSTGNYVQRCDSIAAVVQQSDVIFVAVQTPHAPQYGGDVPITGSPRDFEYAYLVQACKGVCHAASQQRKHVVLAIVSTVLPGTVNRLIRPLTGQYVKLAYTPLLIAMGTTIADFSDPEIVICGADYDEVAQQVADIYLPLHGNDRLFRCDITTAESIKVLYNTYVSMKIVWANHVMEMCHKVGADCDDVVNALSLATDRIISPRYLRGGMGDGGACHPRDLIALSWLEDRIGMSYHLFNELCNARELQTLWLAETIASYRDQSRLPVILLGKAYKPESDLDDGSPALLLRSYLSSAVNCSPYHTYDPFLGPQLPDAVDMIPAIYVITTRHSAWKKASFPEGSIIIDPFGYIADQHGVTMVRIGRK